MAFQVGKDDLDIFMTAAITMTQLLEKTKKRRKRKTWNLLVNICKFRLKTPLFFRGAGDAVLRDETTRTLKVPIHA
ncbi:hypothetical protein E2C01_050185 [Portunus trituberculatus]|uniref:Uncharacterized protein n=1 Tax=Portunus trituberculatus TaxID=210409 RepID=A0A5B7GBD8_PORTR|nr:hypothetical protein [Portunus trituberculatus]